MTLVSIEPATGDVLWQGSPSDVDAEIAAARAAWPEWAAMPMVKRADALKRFSERLANNKDALATLIARETGKPMWEARTEVDSVAGKFEISMKAQSERAAQRRSEGAMGVRSALRHKPHAACIVPEKREERTTEGGLDAARAFDVLAPMVKALRERLQLSQRLRDFAVTDLKLPDNDSYRRYADLGRPAVVWNVVATPELSLTLKTWCYPLMGCAGRASLCSRAPRSLMIAPSVARSFIDPISLLASMIEHRIVRSVIAARSRSTRFRARGA